MKKLTLFIFVLFSISFSYAQEKEKLSEKEKARRQHNIDIGNPFARFGYKPKIATLSKGKYLEFHDRDSIVKIGSFIYHTRKKVITGYIYLDTVRSEATLRPEIVSRWFNPDPLSDEYPSWSPYNFSLNNPIRFIDPDGRAVEDIIIKGANGSSVTLTTDLIDITVNASSLGLDFGGNYNLEGEDVLSAGLDIVGVIDPTGVADGLNATLQAKNGDWLSAGISVLSIVPYVGDLAKVGKIGKDVKIINKAIDVVKAGRKGKAARLRELATDAKLGKADKGWIRQEMNSVKRKSLRKGKDGKLRPQKNLRNPPGKDLAHPYKQRAKNGHSYKNAKLKNKLDHKQEHKIHGYK